MSKHKKRDTWETQGGHIEDGETPLEGARRELFEESGIKDADIYPICDYWGFNPFQSAKIIAKESGMAELRASVFAVGTATIFVLTKRQLHTPFWTVLSAFLWVLNPFLRKIKKVEKNFKKGLTNAERRSIILG